MTAAQNTQRALSRVTECIQLQDTGLVKVKLLEVKADLENALLSLGLAEYFGEDMKAHRE